MALPVKLGYEGVFLNIYSSYTSVKMVFRNNTKQQKTTMVVVFQSFLGGICLTSLGKMFLSF